MNWEIVFFLETKALSISGEIYFIHQSLNAEQEQGIVKQDRTRIWQQLMGPFPCMEKHCLGVCAFYWFGFVSFFTETFPFFLFLFLPFSRSLTEWLCMSACDLLLACFVVSFYAVGKRERCRPWISPGASSFIWVGIHLISAELWGQEGILSPWLGNLDTRKRPRLNDAISCSVELSDCYPKHS